MPVQLGSTPSYTSAYRPPHTQTPQSYPTYGQSSYPPTTAPTSTMSMGMTGVLPGMNSGSYPPPGSYSQYPPTGVSYNMSISMGGFSPYPQPHPHPSAFGQPQPQVPEKPKGPDLFAGLDPFAHS
eukprot:TRINITY_DN818_c0_g1_i5.p1 TRINITY_DN818_c0_g1~~TRINITY_DN818_c0_g1_i5.p1  ORF type:complete len:125 (+),score=4.08 TRINITY_DN818_c0_g1_i5:257-631(+)